MKVISFCWENFFRQNSKQFSFPSGTSTATPINLLEPVGAGVGTGELHRDPDVLSDVTDGGGRKLGHKVDLGLFDDQLGRALLVADGARKLSGIVELDVEDLEPLLLSVDLEVDAVRLFDLLPVLEPLGDGVALAQLDLEGRLLLSRRHGQGLDLLGELWWKL